MDKTSYNLSEALTRTQKELKDCVNELCLRCGEYKREHEGACEGCRWFLIRKLFSR